MSKDYGMFTATGNRLIHNRVETVRKNVQVAVGTSGSKYVIEGNVKAAIEKGIKSYSNMKSEAHGECHDTEVRGCFLHEMRRIYKDATGVDDTEAWNFVDQVYYS